MAHINGRLTSCDRCGETIFRRTTGEGETDGGYTRWNKFEPLPEGWEIHHETGLLCPKCNKEFRGLLEKFNQKKAEFVAKKKEAKQ